MLDYTETWRVFTIAQGKDDSSRSSYWDYPRTPRPPGVHEGLSPRSGAHTEASRARDPDLEVKGLLCIEDILDVLSPV
ncbi:unnamed protein product [Lota lota]